MQISTLFPANLPLICDCVSGHMLFSRNPPILTQNALFVTPIGNTQCLPSIFHNDYYLSIRGNKMYCNRLTAQNPDSQTQDICAGYFESPIKNGPQIREPFLLFRTYLIACCHRGPFHRPYHLLEDCQEWMRLAPWHVPSFFRDARHALFHALPWW